MEKIKEIELISEIACSLDQGGSSLLAGKYSVLIIFYLIWRSNSLDRSNCYFLLFESQELEPLLLLELTLSSDKAPSSTHAFYWINFLGSEKSFASLCQFFTGLSSNFLVGIFDIRPAPSGIATTFLPP